MNAKAQIRAIISLRILGPLLLALSAAPLVAAAPDAPATISHSPVQPRSGQPVAVTAQLPDFDSAILQIQVVEPGLYIRRTDAAFEKSWRDLPMERHGASFIASVPGNLQKHRSLIRYRIRASSGKDAPKLFPPPSTNSSPNFCWFVYDGLPEWKGSSRPGRSPEKVFSPEFLATLPTYHLIANGDDVKNSQWNHNANRRPFLGTLVYDGKVYDHITFNNRGQASTYVAGKNKWGFKFLASDPFAPKNNHGETYQFKWKSFNMNPCASAWAQVNRGMAGMDEALSYRVYQLAGVPSPDTFWIHFRVIDARSETSENQFNSDLWGLYLVVQEKNGTWLRENNLPDGDIFSIDSGPKHLAATQRRGAAARRSRRTTSPQSEEQWRDTLDLPAFYTFNALNRYVANIDLRPEGNHYLYYRPDGRLVILPHDLDMMLIPKHHQPGYVVQQQCIEVPMLKIEYQARARELLDLLASDASPSGGQIGQLVAELSSRLKPKGHQRNWAELDEAMWNLHPRSQERGQFNVTPYDDHRFGGHWTRTLATPNFDGFCKYVLDFCTDSRPRKNFRPNDGNQLGYGYGYLAFEAKDRNIPERPEIRFTSGAFDITNLTFSVSPFNSPADHKPAAVQWRVAQISAPGLKGYASGMPFRYEIEPTWISNEIAPSTTEFKLPPDVCAAGVTYRVRARYKDVTGRWSHWSGPIQFVTASP